MHRIGEFLIKHRYLMWCVVIALSVPPIMGFTGTRLYEGKRDHWASDDDWAEMRDVQNSFEFSGFPAVFVLQCEDFFTPERIAAVRETVTRLKEEELVYTVVWAGQIPQFTLTGLRELLPDDINSEEELKQCRDDMLRHPLVADHLLSKDGRTLLIPLNIGWDNDTLSQLRDIARATLADTGIQSQLTGGVPLWLTNEQANEEDHDRILLTAICVVVVLALLIFRRPSAILIACSGPAVGVIWAEGWLHLLGQHRNELAEIILPVMVLMIGFTDGVHLVIDMRQRRAVGVDARTAASESIGCVGMACLLTSITTAIGFGSLMIGESDMISGFGMSCALGVLVTFVAVVVVVPLLGCAWFGRRLHLGQESDLIGRNIERLSFLMTPVIKHARWFVIGGTLLTGLLIASATQLRPDDRLVHRVPNDSEAYQGLRHCDATINGLRFLQIVIQWPESASMSDVNNVVKQVEASLQEEKLVSPPLSIRSCLQVVPGPDIPQKLQLALPLIPEIYRNQFWDAGSRQTQVVVRMRDLGMAVYQPTIDRLQKEFDSVEKERPGFSFTLTGEALIDSRVVGRNERELLNSLMLAAAVIFVVITLAFRSIRYGIISIIPNILPLAATAALRAMIDVSLDIASACSFAICLGIAVDDTIHFLTRFRNEQAAGHDVHTAIRRTFVTVGTALVMTTVVLVSGFASVMTSQLPTHFLFAAMACTTIGIALLADLFILPALLCCFVPERSTKSLVNSDDDASASLPGEQGA